MPVIALIIGALLAVTDQIIKYFVLTYLQPVGSVTAIDGLLDFTYVENRGVAFGMFFGYALVFRSGYCCSYCNNNIYYVQEETVRKDVLYFCGAYNRRRNR